MKRQFLHCYIFFSFTQAQVTLAYFDYAVQAMMGLSCFQILWNYLTYQSFALIIPDEGCSRNVTCVLNQKSSFLLIQSFFFFFLSFFLCLFRSTLIYQNSVFRIKYYSPWARSQVIVITKHTDYYYYYLYFILMLLFVIYYQIDIFLCWIIVDIFVNILTGTRPYLQTFK